MKATELIETIDTTIAFYAVIVIAINVLLVVAVFKFNTISKAYFHTCFCTYACYSWSCDRISYKSYNGEF